MSLLYFSCSEDPCELLDCGANGTCDEITESCICDDFYEGTNCEIETRERFIGNWMSASNCILGSSGNSNPDITIEKGTAIDMITISSPDILSNRIISGTVNSNSNVVIPEFSQGSTFSGSIDYIDSTKMIMNIDVVTDTEVFNCLYTLTR